MAPQPASTAWAALSKAPYVCRACLCRARVLPWTTTRALQTASHQATPHVPFRKLLKETAKQQRKEKGGKGARLDKWELTVGVEIHAELNTARKLFSEAATSLSEMPNSHVALFDAAFPGSQPRFQTDTLLPALRAALALGCHIHAKSSFDRKHYFYQDQPAGYQITQYHGTLRALLAHEKQPG